MSSVPAPVQRHALGLPAGSVRAAHVIAVVGLTCAIILIPRETPIAIPPYLIYLLFLMLGHYFAAHGVSIATRADPAPSPWYLPGGTVRFLILLALLDTVGWKFYEDGGVSLHAQFTASMAQLTSEAFKYTPLVILGGFLVGVVISSIVGRNPTPVIQDVEAWISVIALVALVIAGVIHLVVDQSLEERLLMPNWEGFVGGVVAFYFGVRS